MTGEAGGELGEIVDGMLILRGERIDFLPEEHPDEALSRLAKCVAAFVNLEPRRKKSVGNITKSAAVLVKNMAILVKSAGVLVKSMSICTKNMDILVKSAGPLAIDMGVLEKNAGVCMESTAILVKSERILIKSKGTPTLSPVILLILLILSKTFLLIRQSPANPVNPV